MKKTLSGTRSVIFMILIACFTGSSVSFSEPGRWEQELSGENWRLWLDRAADWQNDDIYLPPVDISSLPANPPTCGWDNLDIVSGKKYFDFSNRG